jgi:hypothetical protein
MQQDLASLIPPIRRARGYRLYDHRGRRYLDLWQNGGRSLLGHRGLHLMGPLKNLMSRGLLADLPALQGRYLEKALAARLPAYPWVRITRTEEEALALASRFLGRELKPEEVLDPALDSPERVAPAARWRPFLDFPPEGQGPGRPRVLLPVLPFATAGTPAAVCFDASPPEGFPASEALSPVLLAGAARSLYDLARYRLPEWYREDLLGPAKGWVQRGIYLRAKCGQERYGAVFRAFLEAGVLLNPRYPGPSLLPAEASAGELAKMIQLFRQNPGE